MMVNHEWYYTAHASLGGEVSCGVGGLEFCLPADLAAFQIGYTISPTGENLCGNAEGAWRAEWLVIGNETACGDPIFVTNAAPYAVWTAAHGQGYWDPYLIAPTFEAFGACVAKLREYAEGRGSPGEFDLHPSSPEEVDAFQSAIAALVNGDDGAIAFWLIQAEVAE